MLCCFKANFDDLYQLAHAVGILIAACDVSTLLLLFSLTEVRGEASSTGSKLDSIYKEVFDALKVETIGHKLLLAKAGFTQVVAPCPPHCLFVRAF